MTHDPVAIRKTTMARNWESSFAFWAKPPSKTEQERCERVIKAIRTAIERSSALKDKKIHVFVQGSFRNRVNVRQDSDVDVGVMLYEHFLVQYPEGKTDVDFDICGAGYGFSQFKNELEEALVGYFGRHVVTRGNKAFDIKAPASQVEADVVPLVEFRRYFESGTFLAGVALFPDNSVRRIENFPERLLHYWPRVPLHYENGVAKNAATSQRFKGMVRILKKLRIELEGAGDVSATVVPGYLLECLVWNAPNSCFDHDCWMLRVQSVLRFLWQSTKETDPCSEWAEIDDIKYLFHASQPWTREQAHAFISAARDYVGVRL